MSNPIGGVPAFEARQQQTQGAVGVAAEKVGHNNGRAFIASNPASPIAASNMSEEVTALVSRFKKPDDFKLSKGKTVSERQLELIKKIRIVEEIQGIEDFKKRFPEASKPNLKREDYLKEAKEQFKDPFHQYVALYELAVDSKALPDDEIFRAIEALEQEHPQYIEIGKEISSAAGKLAEKYERLSYSEINQKVFGHVKEHKSLAEAFEQLKTNPDGTDFATRVDIRLRRLSGEMNSMTSTTEDTHLRAVIDNMTELKRLVGIHDSCMEAQGEMQRPPNNIEHFNGHKYMTKILQLLNKQFVAGDDFVTLLNEMGMAEQTIPVKTALINKTASLIRDVPEEIFPNEQVKDGLLSAIQEEQDALALAEEGGGTTNESYGKVGERDVNLEGFVRSGDILGDLGVSLTGANDNQLPGILTARDAPAPGQQPVEPVEEPADKQTEMTQGETIQPGTKAAEQGAQGKASNSAGKAVPDSTNSTSAEETAKGSIDGLSDKELIARQDKLLDQARDLQQRKDTDFVYDCSLTALKYAQNNGSNPLSALDEIARARGKGTFAKGLKIAITPEGSGKELRLIPPDQKALQAWLAQHPDQSVADLVRTAITVLEENRDSNVVIEKINNDLASLKESIAQIDSKIKKKPFLRPEGTETFDRLEYVHNFRIQAKQGNASVEATVEATVEETSDAARKQEATPANPLQEILHFEETPAKGTADYIAAKVLGKVAGEQYSGTEDLLKDVRSLSGEQAQLEKLLGYMNKVVESNIQLPLFQGKEEKITEYIQSLYDNKVPNLLNTAIRTDIQPKN